MFNKTKSEGAEIEMTGSQIKQEAPGTSTLKMAEIEANEFPRNLFVDLWIKQGFEIVFSIWQPFQKRFV